MMEFIVFLFFASIVINVCGNLFAISSYSVWINDKTEELWKAIKHRLPKKNYEFRYCITKRSYIYCILTVYSNEQKAVLTNTIYNLKEVNKWKIQYINKNTLLFTKNFFKIRLIVN